ncbi:MAG: PQQ-binding-like beta-propeller repeat protein [Planctomycetes bacterium]|nr:PQQ-binding-like beta-propeller repeat protein [Planctomycetota bacterium]
MKRIVCLLTLLFSASSGNADNWPAWRGPTGLGASQEKSLPLKWTTKENVRWKVTLPAAGNSTPIIWGDRVFITQASDLKRWPPKVPANYAGGASAGGHAVAEKRSVMCFNRADGKLLWERHTIYKEPEITHPTNPFCSASLVTDGKRVIASHGSAGLVCYDFDGKLLWHYEVGKIEHLWGNASSPILHGDLCILWCGPGERQFLLAVNKHTGKKVWETPLAGGDAGITTKNFLGSWATPIVARVGAEDQLVFPLPFKLTGFDLKSGKELWSAKGPGTYCYSSPIVLEGIAVYGGMLVKLGGAGDITKDRLRHKVGSMNIGTAAVTGDYLYVLSDVGVPACYEWKTGKELWKGQIGERPGNSDAWGSPVLGAGRMYITDRRGTTLVFATGPKYEHLATNPLGEHTDASIAISGGDIFIRTHKHLWCIGESKPQKSALTSPGTGALPGQDENGELAVMLEKTLPVYEKAATNCVQELHKHRGPRDPRVQASIHGARFRAELFLQARTNLQRDPKYLRYLTPANLKLWRQGMDHFLNAAHQGKDPYEGMTSGVRVVPSRIDGNLLFYVVVLPKDYDSSKRYPLDVSLHSGASIVWRADRASWFGKPSTDPKKARDEPTILIDPCGRGNNCYVGLGETAVIEAIDDACRHYAVDRDQINIGGASMGGTGAYRLGAFYPDRFAAIHSLTGWPSYGVPLGGAYYPNRVLDNLGNTGVCLWYEPGDLVYQGKKIAPNQEWIDGLAERAKRYPGAFPHMVFHDPKGGHGIIDRGLQADGWKWIRKQVRNPYPARVLFQTHWLRYDGAHWARIDTVEDPLAPARIEAEFHGTGIRVRIDNADRFHLDLQRPRARDVLEFSVSINNGPPIKALSRKKAYFAKVAGKWTLAAERYPPGLVKKRGLSGPVMDVFMGEPVLMVYGTTNSPDPAKSRKMVDDAVTRLFGVPDGGGVLHSGFAHKADKEVNANDITDTNLVLFGTPQTNQVVKKIADKLPVKFLKDGVQFAGKSYTGADVGLVMVYPNPLNPERYVLLLPENYARYTAHPGAMGMNVLTFPDYVIGQPQAGWGGNTIRVLAQGSFDSTWRLK